jgi:hypothetical protein
MIEIPVTCAHAYPRLGPGYAKRRSDVRLATPEPPLSGTMVRLRWVISLRPSQG